MSTVGIIWLISAVAGIIILILGWSIRNLLRKYETAEDLIIGYVKYLDTFSRVIEGMNTKLEKLDTKGSFASDDEVGFFFKNLKELQVILNEFNVKTIDGQHNKKEEESKN
jgi:hypothetical protein